MGFRDRLGLRRNEESSARRRPLAQPSELRARVGQEAIYTENGIASHVRVERVACEGWGVEVELSIVTKPGLVTGRATGFVGSSYSVSSSWAILWVGHLGWHANAQGVNWSLFFDPQLVQEIDFLGASIDGQMDRNQRLRTLRERLSEAYVEDCRN